MISIIVNIILTIIVIFMFLPSKEKKPEIIIKTKVITIPGKDGKMDTIYEPKFIEKENPINKELLAQYTALKDSVSKLNLFKEVITEKEYNEVYEDDVQIISIYTKVQGSLLKQAPKYKIKPFNIVSKDTVQINYNKPERNKILGGLEIGKPVVGDIIFKGNVYLQNKRGNILSAGYDTEKTWWAGYILKF